MSWGRLNPADTRNVLQGSRRCSEGRILLSLGRGLPAQRAESACASDRRFTSARGDSSTNFALKPHQTFVTDVVSDDAVLLFKRHNSTQWDAVVVLGALFDA